MAYARNFKFGMGGAPTIEVKENMLNESQS